MKSGRNPFVSLMFLLDALAEGFQEQETKFSGQMCQQDKLEELFHFYCGEQFHYDMMTFDPEDRCVLQDVIRYEPRPFILEVKTVSTQLWRKKYEYGTINDFTLKIK